MSVVLIFGLVGCGNSTEQKQEESKQETQEQESSTEQEETQEQEVKIEEHEYFILDNSNSKNDEEKIDMNSLKPDGRDFTLINSVDFYNPDGKLLGYMKPNLTIDVLVSNDEWFCLYFEEEEEGLKYCLIKSEDFIANSDYSSIENDDSSIENDDQSEMGDFSSTFIFREVLEKGGMEPSKDLYRDTEDGYMVYIPNEGTTEWAEEKLKMFLDCGLKYFDTEGYGFSKYSDCIKLRLAAEKDNPLSSGEIKEFFNTEVDFEIQKKSGVYYDLFEKFGFDSEKTYTTDEYIEFIKKMGEDLGIIYNEELEKIEWNEFGTHDDFILSSLNCENFTYQTMEKILFFIEQGQYYTGGIEFGIMRGQKDGHDAISVVSKSKNFEE